MKKILSVVLVLMMLLSCVAGLAEGKSLTVGANTAPQNISPFTNFTNRQPVMQYLYETLALRDSATGELYGVIAKSWTTEDNIHYDFEMAVQTQTTSILSEFPTKAAPDQPKPTTETNPETTPKNETAI